MRTRASRLTLAGVAVLVMLGISTHGAWADFVVRGVDTRFANDVLHINSLLDMALSIKSEEALNKGISFDVVTDIALVEHRRFLWNRVVTDRTLRQRVQYHALSGQYLVSDAYVGQDVERFPTAQAALAYVGSLNDMQIPLAKKKAIDGKMRYSLKLRVRLDIESLPAPLRPLAYVTPSWHHSSGWTTWAVKQ